MKIRAKNGLTTLYGRKEVEVFDETERYYIVQEVPAYMEFGGRCFAIPKSQWEPVPDVWKNVTGACVVRGGTIYHEQGSAVWNIGACPDRYRTRHDGNGYLIVEMKQF